MRTFAALALACALGVSPSRAERSFTVEDLLSIEGLGRAAFSPNGRWLVVERQGPFKDAPNFDHEWLYSQTISRLLVVDVTSGGPGRPLLSTDLQAGDTFGAFSPDSARVLVFRLKDHRREMGVVTLATGEVRWSGLTVEAEVWGAYARWRNDREVIVVDKPPEVASLLLGAGWQTQARLTEAWADHGRGRYSGIVLGSGRYRDLTPPPTPLHLVAFDAVTGSMRSLAKGAFSDMLLSPNGATAAMLEEDSLIQPDATIPRALGGQLARWRRLSLVDLTTGKRIVPCPRCDMLAKTWAWSPDGKALAAAARDGDLYAKPFGYWRFSLSGEATRLAPDLVADEGARDLQVQPQGQAVWLGNEPVGLARRAADVRADWWSLGATPRNLTAAIDKPLGLAAAVERDALLVRTAKGVFRIKAHAEPSLVAAAAARLTPGQVMAGVRPTALLDQAGVGTHWLAAGGDKGAAASVDPSLRVLAFSAKTGAVAAADRNAHGVTRVTLLRKDQAAVPVTTLNLSLQEVRFAEAHAVPHRGIHGEALTSWLYLPASHKVSDDRGLVVVPYPGTRHDVAPADPTPGALEFYTNVQLMVARGYAVLIPSLPLALDEPPAPRLAEAILLAADAARAQQAGLSASKLALWGQSFGGYGTLLAGSQSSRFKALIASAPITDLGWMHDTNRPGALAAPEVYLTLGGFAAYTESGQGRMGAKPEDAPDLYRANSPRYQAGKVTAPVLMIFGDLDFGHILTQGMFSALARDGKDVQLVVYRGEQHVPINPENVRDLYRRAFAFLEEAFGGREAVNGAPSAP
jgi:dipeptidyl aminopeptidase/acylaminoacyl peptidase